MNREVNKGFQPLIYSSQKKKCVIRITQHIMAIKEFETNVDFFLEKRKWFFLWLFRYIFRLPFLFFHYISNDVN